MNDAICRETFNAISPLFILLKFKPTAVSSQLLVQVGQCRCEDSRPDDSVVNNSEELVEVVPTDFKYEDQEGKDLKDEFVDEEYRYASKEQEKSE